MVSSQSELTRTITDTFPAQTAPGLDGNRRTADEPSNEANGVNTPATLSPSFARRPAREHGYHLGGLLLGIDGFVATLAIYAGLKLRVVQLNDWDLAFSGADAPLALWSAGGAAVFVGLMLMSGSYEVCNLYRMPLWLKNVIKSILLWALFVFALIGLLGPGETSPTLALLYCMGALLAFQGLSRLIAMVLMLHPRMKHAADERVVVVGWSDKTAHLRNALREDPAQLAEVIGCVPMPGGHFGTKPPPDVAVLGDYSALPHLLDECQASQVVLADDVSCPHREIEALIALCQREMITFRMVPAYFPALTSGLTVQKACGVPLLGVGQLPLDRAVNRFLKRGLDLVGATLGLILSAPIIALFGLLVAWESPGPVIYRQRRISRSGRLFLIYKIRSMRVNAEADTGAVWCTREDPRRLRVGAFMRRWNIDELPQFVNVLRGDMSLVGPRPERPELIERFKEVIPNYNARHEVLAGLTGWAQVNGLRGDTDLTRRIEADLYYLENWSLGLDLYCLVATFFRNKNAH